MEPLDSSPQDAEDDKLINVDFRRYLAAFRKYVWFIAALVVFSIACAVVYTTRVTPIYEAKASVQIEPRLPDLLGTGDMFNVAAGGNNTSEYYKQQKQVLGSYSLCKQTVITSNLTGKLLTDSEMKALSTDDKNELAALRLEQMITIKYPDQDRIMYVVVRSPDAQLATTVANDHVKTYIAYAKGLLLASSTEASTALQAQFDDAEKNLRVAEDKIYKFQAEHDMIAVTLEEHQNLVSANILSFTQKLNDARATEIALASKLTEMHRESKQEVLATPIIMMGDNPSFETLRAQYYGEKIKLLELSKELGAKNPDLISQQQKVDELYKALEGEVKILINGTEDLHAAAMSTHKGLEVEVDRYKDEAKRLSPLIVQYNEMNRQKKLLEDQYNILRARLSTTQLTGNMSSAISNVHPLDEALVPSVPVSPKMAVDVLVGGGLAVVVGLGLVLLLVFLDRSIKTALDATQAAGAPVLGFIPALTDAEVARGTGEIRNRDMYVHEHPTSHVAECCRALRTNVMFSAASGSTGAHDHELKTIVVCSASEQEGKTTTVMYLGTTMAQSGQKVLLVDSDMRRPRLHVSTNVPREFGLSTLLLGDDNYDDVIKPTAVPNLYVLPCGQLPPNPAELLMTKRFETVLAELGKRFTKVILDSPPLYLTDGIVLARRSDGVILVVRSGQTIREELKRAAKMIRGVNGTIFGIVINDRHERDASYGYYYGQYGYSSRPAEEEKPA